MSGNISISISGLVILCFCISVVQTIHQSNFFNSAEFVIFLMTVILFTFFKKGTNSKFSLFGKFMKDCPSVFILNAVSICNYLIALLLDHAESVGSTASYIRVSATWFLSIYIGYASASLGGYKTLCKIAKFIIIFLFLNATYSLIEMYFHYNILLPVMTSIRGVNMYGANYYRVAAMFVNPIPFGTVLVMGIIFAFFFINNKWLKLLVIFFMGISLVFTRARGAWLALACVFLLDFVKVFNKKKIPKKTLSTFAFVIIIGGLTLIFTPVGQNILSFITDRILLTSGSVSESQRLGAIRFILNTIYNSNIFNIIFGHGYYASSRIMLTTIIDIANFDTTDNQYISVLYDYGLLGLIILLLFIIKLIIDFFRSDSKVLSGLDLMLIGFWIASFFYESLRLSNVYFLALFLTGLWIKLHCNEYFNHKFLREYEKYN